MKKLCKISNALTSSKGIFFFACAYLLLCFGGFNVFTTGTLALTYYSHALKIWGLLIILCSLINKKILKFDLRTILSILFITLFIASCYISKDYGGFLNNIKGVLWLLFELIVLFLIIRDKNDKIWIYRFLIVLIIIATINTVISIIFAVIGYVYIPPQIGNNSYWAGMAMGRLYGFYTDPNYGGNIAAITIFALTYIYFYKKNNLKLVITILLSLLQFIYIALSGSRTTLVSLIVSLFIFSIIFTIYKNKNSKISTLTKVFRIILSPILFCCISLVLIFGISNIYEKTEPYILKSLGGPIADASQLFPQQFANEVNEICGISPITNDDVHYTIIAKNENKKFVQSEHIGLLGRDESSDISNNRIELWKNAIQIWKTSPIIGVGHNNILNYAKVYFPDGKLVQMNQTTSHNLFFDILASHGLIGLIIFVALLIACLYYAIKTLTKIKGDYFIMYGTLCSILVLVFISSMFYPEILYANTIGSVVFWYILGHIRTVESYTIGIKCFSKK